MKLLVHLHLYYRDQLPWFIGKLNNLTGFDWDLVVTGAYDDPDSRKALEALKPDVRFVKVPNMGYDIWPFIHVIKTTDLSGYDCVLKIHTKAPFLNTIHLAGQRLSGYDWRDILVNPLIGSTEIVLENMILLRHNPRVGMLCSAKMFIRTEFKEDRRLLTRELRRLGLLTADRRFCAGTMFIARPAVLEYLKSDKISQEMFSEQMQSHFRGSMAHVYERILSIAVPALGYKVKTVGVSRSGKVASSLCDMVGKPLKYCFNIERMRDSEAKYLTLMGFRFRLDDGPGTPMRIRRLRRP